MIVVDPFNRMLYEFYAGRKTAAGWTAMQASIFDLKSNKLRPDGWTSSDAAGLPIFPSIIRFDEVERGMVEHAMRFTVRNSRQAYVYPATHYASSKTDINLPRMGERFRLRADFDISGLLAAPTGHPEGTQEVRNVRGRQRRRLANLGRARQPDQGSRRIAQGQGERLRGDRADGAEENQVTVVGR